MFNLQPPETPKPYPIKHSIKKEDDRRRHRRRRVWILIRGESITIARNSHNRVHFGPHRVHVGDEFLAGNLDELEEEIGRGDDGESGEESGEEGFQGEEVDEEADGGAHGLVEEKIGEVLELGVLLFDRVEEGEEVVRTLIGRGRWGHLEGPGDVVAVAVDHEDDDAWGEGGVWIRITECLLALTGDAFGDNQDYR
ncbi:hypothetical protein V8G54_035681 [Vigna mungo]|uniref:Uncharacterized protein n=1 Tax=Vigna mungo TaxID=3915 RepID=A0AAQ3MFR3_VIGMU